MEVIPAIDLQAGRAVRLVQGDPRQSTDFGDPLAAARRWQQAGAARIHVVDLDGAFAGQPCHLETAAAITALTGLPVQYGGGLRTAAAAEEALNHVDRIMLGTLAVEDPEGIAPLAGRFPGRIMAALDLKDGRPATHGWEKAGDGDPAELARRLAASGVAGLLITDTERDGTLAGAAVDRAAICAGWGVPFLWAGGVTTAEDLAALHQHCGPVLQGVVIGRALYDGKADLVTLTAMAKALREGSR